MNEAAAGELLVISRDEVRRHLPFDACIAVVRQAMIALSRGDTRQTPRQIIGLQGGQAFGVMPGALVQTFGAKLVSVFPENFSRGRQSHQGVVTLFDPDSGAPVCILHAGEITAIRTAAASAVATEALAGPDATRLAVLGYGEQARAHVASLLLVRPISDIVVWGRSPERAAAFAEWIVEHHGVASRAEADVAAAVAAADIICTTTAASLPVLEGRWVRPGSHVNVVGSSHAGPAEIDVELVAMARFFPDHRASVLLQGAEFLHARQAGRVDDAHVLAEIGAVLRGDAPGRRDDREITVYKSLGHVVQDLASGWFLYEAARKEGFGTRVGF